MSNQTFRNRSLFSQTDQNKGLRESYKRFMDLVGAERTNLHIAFIFIFINSVFNLIAPYMMGKAVDKFVLTHQYAGLVRYSLILLAVFLVAMVSGYIQAQLMGRVGQRMMFNLRNTIFQKIQELSIDFFNRNQAGDIISRVNNDTDKINQFFSQSLVNFMSSIFTMMGAVIFLFTINVPLAAVALTPAILIWIFTKFTSSWVKKRNALSLKSNGYLSAEIQESLDNFKVIVAYNRRDYFREKFFEVNNKNYKAALRAGIANNIFMPIYGLSSNIGQLLVLVFGIYLILSGQFTIGLLISFLAYIAQFYNPLRQIATLWAGLQVALAGWDRISQILSEQNKLEVIPALAKEVDAPLLSFRNVCFHYTPGKEILKNVSFDLHRGKTYAFVGPTGGGKTTTASLIARLYDPVSGEVLLKGRDIRSFSPNARTASIGFILQEPYLFTGTIRDNILYGNECFAQLTDQELINELKEVHLDKLLGFFEKGLHTEVKPSGESLSLGQKQILAFIRAVVRRPDLLILDEATANIDTVTEKLLDDILCQLPDTTSRIIIAHRLNTIENADEIFFVNSAEVKKAGSLSDAVNLLLHNKRES